MGPTFVMVIALANTLNKIAGNHNFLKLIYKSSWEIYFTLLQLFLSLDGQSD
jgi:hypothetical protein